MIKDTRVYKQTEHCSIQADIYYVGIGTPVIIYIHSGALIFGNRNWFPVQQIQYLTDSGFSVVNIDYRLAPETAFELIIEDIRDAVIWVRTTATEWYDYDTDNIVLMGSSAGGYLSLLIGTMEIRPKAIVSLYGYGELLSGWYSEPSDNYCKKPIINSEHALASIGNVQITNGNWDRFKYYIYCRQQGIWIQEVTKMDPARDVDELRKYNPIDNITLDFPPTLFLHGDQDTDVPYEQSMLMHNKLNEMGIRTRLITIEGADHVFDHNFNDPQVQTAFKEILYFLKEAL